MINMPKNQQPKRRIIADIPVTITKKAIKNCYLRIDPTTAEVRLSAPFGVSEQFIHQFINDKHQWIEQCRQRIIANPPIPTYQYVTGEKHQLWGQLYPLVVYATTGRHQVSLVDHEIHMEVRANTTPNNRQACLLAWYKNLVSAEVEKLLLKWQPRMEQSVSSWQIRNMKSRWGSCHTHRRHIVLNTHLVHKPKACLEYVLVHEMVHLYEYHHNKRFYALMDYYLPDWRQVKQQLQ